MCFQLYPVLYQNPGAGTSIYVHIGCVPYLRPPFSAINFRSMEHIICTKYPTTTNPLQSTSVASFLVLGGGGGGQDPQCTDRKNVTNAMVTPVRIKPPRMSKVRQILEVPSNCNAVAAPGGGGILRYIYIYFFFFFFFLLDDQQGGHGPLVPPPPP